MSVTLKIPDDIMESIKLPKNRVERELKKELGFLLYERGLASMGISRKLSGLHKWDFIEGLAERGIERHYDEKALEEDISYAKSCK